MSLFKHAMVAGINDALVDRGLVSWPNEAVGFEVCSKLAEELDGPDMLPDGGLEAESAVMIGRSLKEAADTLQAEGYGPDEAAVERTKQAAAMDFESRAAMIAEACMTKAAEDASLTDVGPNTFESAVQTDQHAALDHKNRAANKYLMGVGRTAFPSGGVVGQQMMHPERQHGPSITNSLTALDKQANEEMSAEDLQDDGEDDMHGAEGDEGDMPGAEDVDPEELERTIMFLQALQHKGIDASHPEAQVAAAGLSQDGEKGMEVMAHILDTMKTAEHGAAMLNEVIQVQDAHYKLASQNLVQAVDYVVKTAAEMEESDNASEHASDEDEAEDEDEDASERRKAKKEKEASLLAYLKAAAEGSLTDVDENSEESAAETDSVAELDMHNRAPNEYLTGVGKTRMPNKGQIYAVEHADQDSPVHTDNLPTNETKSAEFAYVNNFRKIASELGPYLPATMSRDEKVAHLQTLMGMPPNERSGYIKALRIG